MTVIDLSTERGKMALEYAGAGYARDLIRDLLRDKPEMTSQELLAAVEERFQHKLAAADVAAEPAEEPPSAAEMMLLAAAGAPASEEYEDGTCKRCGKPVVRRRGGRFITHTDSNGYPTKVGCRAASFTSEHGWDDSIDRKHKATWS